MIGNEVGYMSSLVFVAQIQKKQDLSIAETVASHSFQLSSLNTG